MNTSKTTLQTFEMGDQVVTTIHRIECDGRETADVLNVSDRLELELVEDVQQRAPVVRENVYSWNRSVRRA